MFTAAGLAFRAFIIGGRNIATPGRRRLLDVDLRRRTTSMPAESLMEVLKFLDRGNLEAITLVCRRFAAIVQGDTSQLCLRHISKLTLMIDHDARVTVSAVAKDASKANRRLARPSAGLRQLSSVLNDLSANSYTEECAVNTRSTLWRRSRTLTPDQWNAVKSALMQARAIRSLEFRATDFTDVEADFFIGLALVSSLQCIKFIDCVLLPQHFTNDVLRIYARRGISELTIKCNSRALRAFDLTDDGILHFCFNRPNVVGSLTIDGVVVSDKFLKNICEM
ncbi:hypothetical protein AAVH_15162 [Aphelenchoides avenae]|nr:hypothetical protein AAVH_15162 [Aphelenchus avenae]